MKIKKDWKAVCNFTEYTEAAQYRGRTALSGVAGEIWCHCAGGEL